MAGVTPNLLLPYPTLGDVVDALAWQNLANSVDTVLTTIDGLRLDALKPPVAFVQNSTDQVVVSGTLTNLTWDTDVYVNPSSLHSTSVNTDRITVSTPGVYFCAATMLVSAATTLTAIRFAFTVNGTLWGSRGGFQATTTFLVSTGSSIVVCQNAGDIIRCQLKLNGTGTLKATNSATNTQTFSVYRLSRL